MSRIEILTEEPSMKVVLENILPKILPSHWQLGKNYFIRAHEGKSDLQKSIPKKIRVFSNTSEPTGVVIVHDQDSNDCKKLKKELLDICQSNGNCPVLIRIVCRELEAWYLGDMQAIQSAYPHFKSEKHKNKAKFRNPDVLNAADDIKTLLPTFQKMAGANAISNHLTLELSVNKSESFKQFVVGVKQFFDKFLQV